MVENSGGGVVTSAEGTRVLRCAADGPVLTSGQAVTDLVGDALGHRADVVIVPVERLDPRFFVLSSGVAGEIVQKFVTYGLRLVVLGDIAGHLDASEPLRDFVREANRGRQTWFVADPAELDARWTARG
ncbi:MAG TPA: DUF4180 domain-containing protein [Pseudonocardia sp.]|nr:DUF4180 domain-containing protein [Pseudonocardia sp.]